MLASAGMVLLAAVALAIIFWPSGNQQPSPPTTQQPNTTTPTSDQPAEPNADFQQQAQAVDALLAEMTSTRTQLGTVVVNGCQPDDLRRIQTQRESQLRKARALQVDTLENGTAMRDALVRALTASVSSNSQYLAVAPGCPTDDMVAPINAQATQGKQEFISYWTPTAQKANLPPRTADTI